LGSGVSRVVFLASNGDFSGLSVVILRDVNTMDGVYAGFAGAKTCPEKLSTMLKMLL